jgi:hypothetical protein
MALCTLERPTLVETARFGIDDAKQLILIRRAARSMLERMEEQASIGEFPLRNCVYSHLLLEAFLHRLAPVPEYFALAERSFVGEVRLESEAEPLTEHDDMLLIAEPTTWEDTIAVEKSVSMVQYAIETLMSDRQNRISDWADSDDGPKAEIDFAW